MPELKTVAGIAWANKAKITISHDIKKIPGESDGKNTNLSLFDQQNDLLKNQHLKAQNEDESTFSMQLIEIIDFFYHSNLIKRP